tara:strand:- start:7759 stop:9429 length:1671 start_codon:yes stop_codon:yes gene_type:complete
MININNYLYEFMLENKILFLICFVLLFNYPLQRLFLPKYYGKVISSLKKNPDKNFFDNTKILIFIYAATQIFHTIYSKVQGYLIPEFTQYSLKRIFITILKNKELDFENLNIGEILAKIIKIPHLITQYIDVLKTVIFSQLILYLSCCFHYYNISLKMVLTFIFLLVIVFVLQIIKYKSTMELEVSRQDSHDKIYKYFQDVLNNLITISICKGEKHETKVIQKIFFPYIEVYNKLLNYNFIMRTIFCVFNIFSFVLLNYVLYSEFYSKKINRETYLSSFIVTYSILQLFSDSSYAVRLITDIISQVKDLEYYFNKILLKENKLLNDENSRYVNGDIVFKNVSYGYEENKLILKNINLHIKQNDNIAIIGHIGSGKSTLIKLLLKLKSPKDGNIFIGNVNLNNISLDELYNHVFYIPQKPKLLNRTLYENIVYGLPEVDKYEMIKKINNIMNTMKLDDHTKNTFIEKLDENIGNEGSKISGGQRQILWIMRALIRNPSIIIMDEPTSSLDKDNKDKIFDIINNIGINKTIIIITHDDIGFNFKKIYMNNGEIKETFF